MSVSRMKNFDYGSKGKFLITICTFQMKHYFGKVIGSEKSNLDAAAQTGYCPSKNEPNDSFIQTGNGPSVLLSPIGMQAKEFWIEIPKHYSYVELDEPAGPAFSQSAPLRSGLRYRSGTSCLGTPSPHSWCNAYLKKTLSY